MSQEDFKKCFGDRLWYSEDSHALLNLGEPLPGLSEAQRKKYERNKEAMDEYNAKSRADALERRKQRGRRYHTIFKLGP
jgi:hypothetical protein